MRNDRRRRRAGFTLVELIVYLALVTGALTVMVGLEMAASRASFLERALIDLALRGDDLGTRFRDDVRQATRIVESPTAPGKTGTVLIVGLPSGGEVRYELETSEKLKVKTTRLVRLLYTRPGADPLDRTVYEGLERFALQRTLHRTHGEDLPPHAEYALDAAFVYARGGEISARRSFHYTASPIAEEAP